MNNNDTKKKKIFEVKGVDFDPHAESRFMNTNELGSKLNSLLTGVFRDFDGMEVGSVTNLAPAVVQRTMKPGELYVNIVLKPGAGGTGIPNLVHRGEANATDTIARLSNMFGSEASRIYTVTDDTKAAVAEIINKPGSMDWNQRIVEVGHEYDSVTNRQELLVKIIGIPLINLIELYYSTEDVDEDGTKVYYEYTVAPIRQTADNAMLVQITRMDKRTVNDIANSVGMYQNRTSYVSANYNRR